MADTIEVRPSTGLAGTLAPPGAKSGTVRALLAGTLATGTTVIRNAGSGDNVRAMTVGCRALGARITGGSDRAWTVEGTGGKLPDTVRLDAGNSGIVLRLLAAVGAAATSTCVVGTRNRDSLGRRGNLELIDALRQLGADCHGTGDDACPPLSVSGGARLHGGTVAISGRRSSQPVSGLLFLAPLIGEDVEVVVREGLSAPAMVQATIETLARSGITVQAGPDGMQYRVTAGQTYRPAVHQVPTDASSVAGILAVAAAAPESQVSVTGVAADDHAAGLTVQALARMGVRIERTADTLTVYGAEPDQLRPVELDGSGFMDSVLPLAALACYAPGTTVFSNVEPLRFKECDRISDFRQEMCAAGADIEERTDALIVHGKPRITGGTQVRGRHDHSVVMALATLAVRSDEGLAIEGWRSVGQTYRNFFEDLESIGARVGSNENEGARR
ncbi:MAG TPA: 3-phosphoshikimate 1-carboxyvinyltransferase [Kineosporiaceae bacterium]|nr:3-phosphoshikimate 1-carboxyvinyltransferase [Kineosporiaceae bacterium]